MLEQKLNELEQSDIYPFHMPGHKRAFLPFANPYAIDITEIEGFDNLHHATGILQEAQQKAADLYGAKKTYYLVNGSTCGLLAAISAAVPRGGKILVARNCHKAVYHAMYLRQLVPVYIYPEDTACGIQGQVTPQMVRSWNRYRISGPLSLLPRHMTGSYRISKALRTSCMHMGFH